jgi:hypothetical protein
MTKTYSSKSNCLRAAKGAGIPDGAFTIEQGPQGWFFTDTREQPAAEPVPNAFNEGTNSAGEPAAAPAKPARKGRTKAASKAAKRAPSAASARTRDGTKEAQLIEMLRRPDGATIQQIAEAFGWQHHTVRGAFAGALKRKRGLTVTSEKLEGKDRVYRLT